MHWKELDKTKTPWLLNINLLLIMWKQACQFVWYTQKMLQISSSVGVVPSFSLDLTYRFSQALKWSSQAGLFKAQPIKITRDKQHFWFEFSLQVCGC